jgi:hypothetical protein
MINFNYTSIPALEVNDAAKDANVITSWVLLIAACLGVLWAFAPREQDLRCCARRQEKRALQNSDPEKPNSDPEKTNSDPEKTNSDPDKNCDPEKTNSDPDKNCDLEKGNANSDCQVAGSAGPPKEKLQDSKGCVAAAPGGKTKEKPKLFFIDNLKLFMIFLVVNTHTSAVFDQSGGPFKFNDFPSHFKAFSRTMFNLNQAYYMALFFLLSGYFMPSSLDRKGLSMFLEDKFKRLGLPAIAYFLGLGPLMMFGLDCAFGLRSDYQYNPIQGPEWFILWLLGFSVVYGFVAQCTTCPSWMKLPGVCGLMALGFLLGTLQFLFSIHFTRFGKYQVFMFNPFFEQCPFYVAFFAAGIAAKRNGWLEELASFSNHSLWALRSLTVLFAGLIIFFQPLREWLTSSNQDASAVHEAKFLIMLYSWALVQCLFGVAVSVVEIDLFRRCLNCGGGKIHRFLTESMYGVYLIHYPFVHFFAWTYTNVFLEQDLGEEMTFSADPWCWLRFKCSKDGFILQPIISTPIPELQYWYGWVYTTVLTLVVVFPLAHFLRKLPFLRDIL